MLELLRNTGLSKEELKERFKWIPGINYEEICKTIDML